MLLIDSIYSSCVKRSTIDHMISYLQYLFLTTSERENLGNENNFNFSLVFNIDWEINTNEMMSVFRKMIDVDHIFLFVSMKAVYSQPSKFNQ